MQSNPLFLDEGFGHNLLGCYIKQIMNLFAFVQWREYVHSLEDGMFASLNVPWPSGRFALDSSSGVVRMWVRIPPWPVAALVSLSKTLNHNCFVLRMGRKAVGPVCYVMHVKEPRTLIIVKEKGACPCVSGFAPWAPSRVDKCALQIFCIIIIIINGTFHLSTIFSPLPS